eukprot:1157752-Pelagomonas_calceolata.AAC.6
MDDMKDHQSIKPEQLIVKTHVVQAAAVGWDLLRLRQAHWLAGECECERVGVGSLLPPHYMFCLIGLLNQVLMKARGSYARGP